MSNHELARNVAADLKRLEESLAAELGEAPAAYLVGSRLMQMLALHLRHNAASPDGARRLAADLGRLAGEVAAALFNVTPPGGRS